MRDPHIRIRIALGGLYVWELLTADGHIVSASEGFGSRQECQADARRQGLAVHGEPRRAPALRQTPEQPAWTLKRNDQRLWLWRHLGEQGEEIAASSRAFLTKAECVADARRYGYPG